MLIILHHLSPSFSPSLLLFTLPHLPPHDAPPPPSPYSLLSVAPISSARLGLVFGYGQSQQEGPTAGFASAGHSLASSAAASQTWIDSRATHPPVEPLHYRSPNHRGVYT
eukprot:GHVT01044423.1.p3 GENE.GHVT01044423.1~~GHVT01044423.1.p3  ORF type:complete len:110 (+),score=19.00 GHVT01044423.1:1567-1896(+)